jgi:hypothetical protein
MTPDQVAAISIYILRLYNITGVKKFLIFNNYDILKKYQKNMQFFKNCSFDLYFIVYYL